MNLPGNQAFARIRPRAVLAAVEMTLLVLVAVQAARLLWITVAPDGPFESKIATTTRPEFDFSALTRFNPFESGKSAATNATASSGFHLFGVRTDGAGGGAAIISGENIPQSSFAVGDEIAPGVRLRLVAADHVVLARGASETILPLSTAPSPQGVASLPVPSYLSPATQPAKAQAVAPVAINPKEFLEQAGLRPRNQNGQVTGYTLLTRGDGDALARAGLQSGDVLVAVNGNRMTPERYSELAQELTGSAEVSLTVERGSETRTIVLRTAGQ